ncbi:U3 small nucleolar RNA-associated protein 6 homolog isoform X2 [Neocloeon triangulifer]|uniref:U3 small nucleolar RNA-associated protein 6 homolog isoform X2 n=1 Tax=Neocloeon triangulifer TaxID=2078957 RepID=UPI00286F3ADD|nr:U3 small nucleolar RNA-associated protein 6 homolog isoform X2 [Neocloeon triangulifer]
MAEFVQLRLEEMRPELEQYAKFELFGMDEIREITIKRKDLEYKVQKRNKSKEDYLKYIQYEVDLLKLLRLKLQSFQASENTAKIKRELCKFIINRIMHLLYCSVTRFPEDIKLWLTYIKFCKSERRFSEVSRNLEKMLKFHGNKEQMWQIAAHWEYLECDNIESARAFLLTGMRHHPHSEFIYSEAVWLELKYASDLRSAAIQEALQNKKEPDLNADMIMQGALAQVMYETAIEKVNSCEFLCSLLKIVLDFDFVPMMHNAIKTKMTETFSGDLSTWICLARLELEGFLFEGQMNPKLFYKRKKCPDMKPTKRQILFAYDILNKAVQEINTEESWSQFIEILLDLLEKAEADDKINGYPNLLHRLLKETLDDAHIRAKLPSAYYSYYIEYLGDDEDKIEEVLQVATDRHPKDLDLWMARLKLSFVQNSKDKSKKIFECGIKELNESDEELELWLLMTEHFADDESLLEKLFRKSSSGKSKSVSKIKIMHLNFIFERKGLLACRSLYSTLSIVPPFSIDLHKKMVEIELQQEKVDVKSARKCYELACDQFGGNDSDIWMDFINFELKFGSKTLIAGLYMRASKTLAKSESEIFIQKYHALQNSM